MVISFYNLSLVVCVLLPLSCCFLLEIIVATKH